MKGTQNDKLHVVVMQLAASTAAVNTVLSHVQCMANICHIYLTIIPQARVGYEMVNSQRGA